MSAAAQGIAQSPLIVYYQTIRQRYCHKDRTPEGRMRIVSKHGVSGDGTNPISCKAELRWATWKVDFKCTYNPATDRFQEFEDTGMIETSDWPQHSEEENDIREPSGAMCFSLEELDENGHPFLRVRLFFYLGDDCSDEHTDWQLWLKRVQGVSSSMTNDEKARLETAGSSPCDHCDGSKVEKEEEEREMEGGAEQWEKDVGVVGGSRITHETE